MTNEDTTAFINELAECGTALTPAIGCEMWIFVRAMFMPVYYTPGNDGGVVGSSLHIARVFRSGQRYVS